MLQVCEVGEEICAPRSEVIPMRPFAFGIALVAILAVAPRPPVTIAHVRSGRAELVQRGRLTVLELTPAKGTIQRIALTHPSDWQQGTNAPFGAKLVAESPQRFLIFTDSFDSNPGNPQGQCGAYGPTENDRGGERFVHVVALGAVPHETLSVLVESCLLDLEPAATSPEWLAAKTSGGSEGQLTLRFEHDTQTSTIYYVMPDGSITRPKIKPNPE
jgi:hypothetical protein